MRTHRSPWHRHGHPPRSARRRSVHPLRWLAALALLGALAWLVGQPGSAQAASALRDTAPVAAQRDTSPLAASRACAELAGLSLAEAFGAGSAVRSAREQGEGEARRCVVSLTLAPAIGVELRLPPQGWTQRYLQMGCGGLCGSISQQVAAADGCPVLQAGGFVTGATDMGHQGMGGEFGRDPVRRSDFAHRAQHLTAQVARQVIAAYYGRPPAYAYFSGCSDGGREALVEAQRYPDDFDGVIAGAPALLFQVQNSLFHGWQARSNTGPDGRPVLKADRLPLLHREVLRQCDALDGQVDGLIAQPLACQPQLAPLRCADGQAGTDCLGNAEVAVAQRFYDGPRDPVSGVRLTGGQPQPGSELAWAGVYVPRGDEPGLFSEVVALAAIRHLVFETPPAADLPLSAFGFSQATFDRLQARHPLFDASNPDLRAFAARGGKLILWHGWADPHISPLNTLRYHQAVAQQMGAAASGFERLYLLPGVYHCGDGEGASAVDLLTPMLRWVEQGEAPAAIEARAPAPRQPPSGAGQPVGVGAVATASAPPPGPVPTTPVVQRWTLQPIPGERTGPWRLPAWAGDGWFTPYVPRGD